MGFSYLPEPHFDSTTLYEMPGSAIRRDGTTWRAERVSELVVRRKPSFVTNRDFLQQNSGQEPLMPLSFRISEIVLEEGSYISARPLDF